MEKTNTGEPETISPAPFNEGIHVELFFSGAHRRKLLEEVKKAIVGGVAVMTLTGDEGSGKSMICHMVIKELTGEMVCVYFSKTLESFDDVVRVLALRLDTEMASNPVPTNELVTEIAAYLKEKNKRLVAIFDDAERMYLATIERIRKMLDAINSEEILMQVIFVGRKNLIENLSQLSIIQFAQTSEAAFSLEPLGLSETYAYLNYSMQQRTQGKGKNVFTPEAAKKIYSMAKGNLRITNMLASKSLEAMDSENSFMVLLENVYEEAQESKETARKRRHFQQEFPGKKWIAAVVAALVIIVALIFFFRGDDDQGDGDEHGTVTESVAATPKAVDEEKSSRDESKDPGKRPEEAMEVIGQKADQEKKTPVVERKEELLLVTEGQETEKKSAMPVQQKAVDEKKVEEVAELAETEASTGIPERAPERQPVQKAPVETQEGEMEREPSLSGEADSGMIEQEGAEDQGETVEESVAEPEPPLIPRSGVKKVFILPEPVTGEAAKELEASLARSQQERQNVSSTAALQPTVTSDRLASSSESQEQTTAGGSPIIVAEKQKKLHNGGEDIEAAKQIVQIAPVKLVRQQGENSGASGGTADVDAIFKAAMAAGKRWLSGASGDRYTVQLMALSADMAEESLKKKFSQKDYQLIADQLHIMNNASTYFVFYGEYPDAATARDMRSSLPPFLQKLSPYTLMVKEAIEKIGVSEE